MNPFRISIHMQEGERLLTEIIVLHEAINSVKIDFMGSESPPIKVYNLVKKWEARLTKLEEKLKELYK